MASVGTTLKNQRLKRGLSLKEVALATKIGPHLLEALEQDDLAHLPGGPFNKGFVRGYARVIGLDPEAMVDAYSRQEKAQGLSTPDAHRGVQKEKTPLFRFREEDHEKVLILNWPWTRNLLLALVSILVLLPAGWLFMSGSRRQFKVPSLPAAKAATRTEGSADAATPLPALSAAAAPGRTLAHSSDGSGKLDRDHSGESHATGSSPESTLTPGAHTPQSVNARTAAALVAGHPADARLLPQPPAVGDHRTSAVAARLRPRQVPESTPGNLPPQGSRSPDRSRQDGHPHTAAEAGVSRSSRLSVVESGVGRGVTHRQLVGRSHQFVEGGKVWFWTRSVGGQAGDILRHVWIHQGKEEISYDLKVGGPHWRNASLKTLKTGSAGAWSVEARSTDGRVLSRAQFVCVSAPRP